MFRKNLVFAALLLLSRGLQAKEISLTVYNQDLALVREARRVKVEPGIGELRFADVAAQMDPTSVHFSALGTQGKISLLEQNYEYDLVSLERILQKYLDQEIQVFAKEGKLFSGKLLSAQGALLLEKKDGGVQSVSLEQVQNVDFPKLPEGLMTRPTLVWLLNSERGGERDIEVSYLTRGIGWHAEYVGVLDQEERKISLSGWVTVDNRSGASYEDAKLKLVAGEVHQVQPKHPPVALRAAMAAAEGAPDESQFAEKTFFEYHLYILGRSATVKDQQMKQISLFPSATASVKKTYQYDGTQDGKNAAVTLEVVNSKSENLGIPLPAGKVRIYKEDTDRSQEFIGEDAIEHTPRDEKLRLQIGKAFDVLGERRQKDTRSLSQRSRQDIFEIKIKNRKDSDIEVTVVEHLWGDWEITKSSLPYEKKDTRTVEFKLPAAKNSEASLEYTVVTRW